MLSLVGRALFFRFLCDREVVTERNAAQIAPGATELRGAFDNAGNAFSTSQWLDRTFKGDFLPLKDGGNRAFFDAIHQRSNSVFNHLSAIVRGLEPAGAADYQLRLKLKWSDFDFAHVPVGLLSQVYEAFCWKWEHRSARETSVHYTPRKIASTLVNEAFDGMPEPHKCTVLDPACGAGVFLVLAFRRLYRETWKAQPERPDTKVIRKILEDQLRGFDISDAALRLAALSLYLTAVELDPDPIPPSKLRFKALKNLVLFNHRRQAVDPEEGLVVGSLGPHVSNKFLGSFDLILSNPPWTSLPKREKKLALTFTEISRDIIAGLDPKLAKPYENPDSVPDLPFVWKATQWCKPGGRIAMALPSRILFKQGENAVRAREAILRLIAVTGIINCSNLRKTEVWPNMDQPFMLFFAQNQRPRPGHTVQFITPHTDFVQNARGEMRIDCKSAQRVEVDTAITEPWLWKALTVGTWLDVEVVKKLKSATGRRLQDYWETDLRLASSNGYQVKITQKQQDAKPLKVLHDLKSAEGLRFLVETNRLGYFASDTAFRPRLRRKEADPLRVYRGPLLLVKESPGPKREHGWALLCLDDVAYNESFYGYSAAGQPHADLLVRYLQLLVHSHIWLHYALVTSAKLGAERPNVDKSDLDDFPVIPIESLSADDRATITSLSARLVSCDAAVFQEIDKFFGMLYRLTNLDRETIRDTLEVREPHDELGKRASLRPKPDELNKFKDRLGSALRPFFKAVGKQLHITVRDPIENTDVNEIPFAFLAINADGSSNGIDPSADDMILQLAADTGTTRIIQEGPHGLHIGLLLQYRYWTPTRARLLATEIVRGHMRLFEG